MPRLCPMCDLWQVLRPKPLLTCQTFLTAMHKDASSSPLARKTWFKGNRTEITKRDEGSCGSPTTGTKIFHTIVLGSYMNIILSTRYRLFSVIAHYKIISPNKDGAFLHPLLIPSTLNVVADGLSSLKPLNTEWTLPPEAFSAILRWAGPLQVDLLASPTNYRLLQWVSLFPHPDAVACNCLSIDWNGFASIYAFPLVGLILTLLPLIRGYRGRLVLVAPWDPHAP